MSKTQYNDLSLCLNRRHYFKTMLQQIIW